MELVKPQAVRIADVFLIGPAMIWAGLDLRPPRWLRWGMIAAGVGTIVYNARNYLLQLEAPNGY